MNITNYPFYLAYNHLNDFYGIILNEDEFETIGLHAWHHIGNKRTKYYTYFGNTTDSRLDLPCNVDIIEAVTSNVPDYQMTDNVKRESYGKQVFESYIEARKSNRPNLYVSGKYLNYHQEGNTLVFDHDHTNVAVLYKGVLADDNVLPFVNVKEMEAIAVYCAYVYNYKKAMITKDGTTMQFAKDLKLSWDRKCSQARTPERINQNEMDDILDVSTSWDRKRFGVSYKPIKK